MPLSDQTDLKYDNSPIPDKNPPYEDEGRRTACKMYTTFLHKIFDYLLIPPFKYGYNL